MSAEAKKYYKDWISKQPFTEKELLDTTPVFQKERWFDFADYAHQAQLNEVTDEDLPAFLYRDTRFSKDGVIRIGYHGDADVTEEWKEFLEHLKTKL